MHAQSLAPWEHDHAFGQDVTRPGERRTVIVVVLTAVTMVVEIMAGLAYGSMALLADGLHMASHTAALGIAVIAYVCARRFARDRRFTFGTGKINALGGFASAVLLAVFALLMAWESTRRLFQPLEIAFDQAILVAVLGLAVNLVSALILRGGHDHGQGLGHHHGHGQDHGHEHGHGRADARDRDHNLRSAYVHVLADALTSVLAIAALLAGKLAGLAWMDPTMGLVGAAVVTVWAVRLLRDSGSVLLDWRAPERVERRIRAALEAHDGDRLTDLHVWSVGPGVFAAELAVVAHRPHDPDHYKGLIPEDAGIVHATVEVHRCGP
ncbi:MAG: cation transporter [Rhodospirillales bacterium]|nr:MAG: cation transporter [Rhodospirillales bacterium]